LSDKAGNWIAGVMTVIFGCQHRTSGVRDLDGQNSKGSHGKFRVSPLNVSLDDYKTRRRPIRARLLEVLEIGPDQMVNPQQ
jgi:hypothetical protein